MVETPVVIQNLYAKYSRILFCLDRHITINLNESNVETRPGASNGLWCCVLLPAVLMLYTAIYKVSPLYNLVACVSLGLFLYCLLFITFMSVSGLVLWESVYGGCVASSLVSTLLLYTFLKLDLTYSLIFTFPTIYLFSLLLRTLLVTCPKTFTIGEAMVVSQSLLLYAFMIVARIVWDTGDRDEIMDMICTVVNTVLTDVGIIVTSMYFMGDNEAIFEYIGKVLTGCAIYSFIAMHSSTLGWHSIPAIVRFVFFYKDRSKLVAFWLFLLIISIVTVSLRTKMAIKATTVSRKSFHILASLVFLTGIIQDPQLMMLAAGIGLGVLILAETMRKAGIEPMASALQSAFEVFSDEKDVGELAMTPLYLYCGLACPLVLVPHADPLEALSGVLSIGVGDSAASWFGSKFGHNKWSESSKSLEGTIFNILSQICTVYALQLFNLLNGSRLILRTAAAATITALVEAKTDQVDNMVLPLVMMLSFQLTFFLRETIVTSEAVYIVD